jgi:hypothetical protein
MPAPSECAAAEAPSGSYRLRARVHIRHPRPKPPVGHFSILGGAIACVFLGTIAGTAGWVGTVLVGCAIKG